LILPVFLGSKDPLAKPSNRRWYQIAAPTGTVDALRQHRFPVPLGDQWRETMLQSEMDEPGRSRNPKFVHDMTAVGLRGGRRDAEAQGNFLIGQR